MTPKQLQAYQNQAQKVAKQKRNPRKKNPRISQMEEDIMRGKIRRMIEKTYPKKG